MVNPALRGSEAVNMQYFAYIIKSERDNKNYIGSTSDVKKRLTWHNAGKNTSTKCRTPFRLIYQKEFGDKSEALAYEMWLKKQKGGLRVKELIAQFQKN